MLAGYGSAQTKTTTRPTKTVPATETPSPTASPTPVSTKKNERPSGNVKPASDTIKSYKPTYFYEFTRPGFVISHILIEHDSNGTGKISYLKQDFPEMVSDPIQLTPTTLKGINDALERMDFLSSTEKYQFEKDFSNMGDNVFRLVREGRERTVKYNWTANKDAKFLIDEYRRIANEAVWKADILVARVNQPLETAGKLDEIDAYLRLGEISDPPHLIPFLKELSTDERLPLLARNHATRLIQRIEKAK
jgi:hypothetical protein